MKGAGIAEVAKALAADTDLMASLDLVCMSLFPRMKNEKVNELVSGKASVGSIEAILNAWCKERGNNIEIETFAGILAGLGLETAAGIVQGFISGRGSNPGKT